jgi:hypothetical protein
MYAITIIRLSKEDLKFENTEFSTFMLYGGVIKALSKSGFSAKQLNEILSMAKGEKKTFEALSDKIRIAYIFRIN